ncbi:PAS domain-containing protein [Tundrisphaera sp. TA3]|uniref:PAS domain-containing protein n=1 Tax=Tundrisphaera sp. TA3 TaxID=3435775 RepID=UPI003EBAC184
MSGPPDRRPAPGDLGPLGVDPMTRSLLARQAVSAILVGIAFMTRGPIEAWAGVDASPGLYLPMVTLAAWYGGLGSGLTAVFLAGLSWAYYDAHPDYTLLIEKPHDLYRIGSFLIEGILVSVLMDRLLAARQASEANAREAGRYREASSRNEARLQAILDNSAAPIWLKDVEGRYILANRLYVALARPNSDEPTIEGLTDADLFPPAIAEALRSGDLAMLEAGHATESEEILPLADGPHTFLSVKFPLRDEEGRTYAIGGISTDITRRKDAEQALIESEDELRLERDFAEGLIETAQVIVLVLDHDGRVVRVNPFLERVAGYRPEEVRGADWFARCVPAGHRARAVAAFRRAIVDAEGCEITHALLDRDGREREVNWALRSLDDGPDGSTGVLAIGHDITELKEAQRRALQAERLAAIGQMVTGLAHESRNALQRSQACLEMLAFRLEERPEELDLVAGVQDAQDDLHRLYEEVRTYAAPILLDRRSCSLSEILMDAWSRLEVARKGRVATLAEVGGPPPTCDADLHRMVQVFRNILDNSLDACDDPVRIVVTWSDADLAGKPAVRVAIRDNGPGLTAEQRKNLFEPFFTTKTQGTGLGMPIVRRIVEAHGGLIGIGTPDGPGAEIVILLPRGNA